MISVVGLVSHLIAFVGFAILAVRLLGRREQNAPNLWMALSCIVTAGWALTVVLAAQYGESYLSAVSPMETLRSMSWIVFLAVLLMPTWRERRITSSFIIALIVGFILAMQLALDLFDDLGLGTLPLMEQATVAYGFLLMRLTVAIGGLVLVHNLYVNTAAISRWGIQLLCIGLAALFLYDLNLYTMQLLWTQPSADLFEIRGIVDAMIVPVLALSVGRTKLSRLQFSRSAAFHTLSLGAVGGYLVLMSLAAYGLRLVGGDWGRLLQVTLIFGALVVAAVVVSSGRYRAAARVWINKHFFTYKFDYREEWLRFIATISTSGPGTGDLSQRVVQAVCAIVDSPGGVLLLPAEGGAFELTSRWNFQSFPTGLTEPLPGLVQFLETRGRIVDLDELRGGQGDYGDLALPDFARAEPRAWLAVPLLHLERLAGVVVLEQSLAARELNWEDYDLLRTVGKHGASYIAEAASQAQLLESRKFDEFNRRFAFIMHDIKNLVSQLSLVARNAERHADNPEFRADMVKTLQSSVGKMNDLLARLSQHNTGKPDEGLVDVAEVVRGVVAAKKDQRPAPKIEAEAEATVNGDPTRFEQVVAHLVQNGIDASGGKGSVTVRMAIFGGEVRIDIADGGTGMSAAFIRNELFAPFRSTKSGGFGIGAYEAREIVRGMGGRLDVVSREGEGSLFSVILPLAETVRDRRPVDAGGERKRA